MNDIFEMRQQGSSGEELLEELAPAFPYTASRAFLDRYDVLWHWHRAVELFYMESGALEYETPGGRVLFPAGSGGLVNTGVLHTTRLAGASGRTVQLLHIFDASLLFGQPESRIFQKYGAPILSARTELIPLFPDVPRHRGALERLAASFRLAEGEAGYELKLREALSAVWLDLLGLLPEDTGDGTGSCEKIKGMLRYIHSHYRESVRVSDVAAAGYVSQRECYRAFRQFLHTTPGEYIRSCRLREACRMLAEGSGTITEISHACGFGSSSFFGKVFLAGTGMTPTDYRRKWQDPAN